MRLFLPLLCVVCAAPVHGVFDGACPRKDPPPGVLVVPPGSKLVLMCRGYVMVDGVKVNSGTDSSNANRGGTSSVAPTTTGNIMNNKHTVDPSVNEGHHFKPEVGSVTTGKRSPRHTDIAYTASPTTHLVQPTGSDAPLTGESDWEAEEADGEGDYEDEEDEGEEGSRVTRGIKSRPQWKWNMKVVGSGKRDWGDITFERRGSPESPSLSCYKKSPSSKIRCEWTPQKPVAKPSNCYLVLNKSPSQTFNHLQCSYSSRLSRYWCALDHSEDDLRTTHTAFLCVTTIAGNATSNLQHFTPLSILKPDPPSDVKVTQLEGHETWIKVWMTRGSRSHLIKDIMPGVQYQIQLRARDEFDGKWSDWSTPINASSWTAPVLINDPITTDFPDEGSTDIYMSDVPGPENIPPPGPVELSHVLWISGLFLLLTVILAAYMFRHRDRLMSKLHRVSVIIQPGNSSEPPSTTPAAPEQRALMTFTRPHYKEPSANEGQEEEEENEEEPSAKERTEAMHFNNTSYFFIQRESI
ncbi:hypothetical protein INR49_005524 [Caranx melampygus]|nr:hypothetical protein INR49_005524 [Caranx melampygus]